MIAALADVANSGRTNKAGIILFFIYIFYSVFIQKRCYRIIFKVREITKLEKY